MIKRVVFCLWVVGCGSAKQKDSAEPKAEVALKIDSARDIKVFSGEETLRVLVVPVSGDESATHLLEVRGSDSVADGMVWPVTLKSTPTQSVTKSYSTMSRGVGRSLLWQTESRYGGASWTLSMPTDADAVSWLPWGKEKKVNFDEKASAEVKADQVLTHFGAQTADGTLAIRTKWDRTRREKLIEDEISAMADEVNAACGTSVKPTVDWESIDDETLKEISITSYCEDGFDSVAEACTRYEDAKAQFATVSEIQCSFAEPFGMKRQATKLAWHPSGANNDKLADAGVKQLLGHNLLVAKAKSGVFMAYDTTDDAQKLYFGDGKTFRRQRMTFSYSGDGGGGIFYAGRRAQFKTGKKWSVACGSKKYSMAEISAAEKKTLLKDVTFGDYEFDREAHALARDSKGVYYYVDKRLEESGGKDFRVYVGKKGAAEVTKLQDIVNDSEGQIFSTAEGKLRLLVGSDAYWIEGKAKNRLKVLRVNENLGLIYNELGAYDGMASGSVCDQL